MTEPPQEGATIVITNWGQLHPGVVEHIDTSVPTPRPRVCHVGPKAGRFL